MDADKTSGADPATRGSGRSEIVDGLRRGALFGLGAAALGLPVVHWWRNSHPAGLAANASTGSAQAASGKPRLADFSGVEPSGDARQLADWVADSRDNHGGDFVIVDKKNATVHVFDSHARLIGSTPVLLGYAAGDHTVEGIGQKPIEQIKPEERTTPAGRFIAERGRNASGEDVVWIDYDAAVSMHRVRATNPAERRLERLASPTIDDNRVSWGCINVPVAFYEQRIQPIFAQRRAVVYVLPEVMPLKQVFAQLYDPRQRSL